MNNKMYKNMVLKLILSASNFLIPLISAPYIARLLDENLYGDYNKAISEIVIFNIIAAFGIYNYAVREISKIRNDINEKEKVFSGLFSINLISTTFSLIIYFIYIFKTINSENIILYIILSGQIVSNYFMVEWMNESVENYRFITIKTIVIKVVSTISLFLFVKDANDILIYAIVTTATLLINNIASFVYVVCNNKIKLNLICAKKHIKPILFIFIISNTNLLYTQLDKIFLGAFVSPIAVTEYILPQSIMNIIFSLLLSISVVTIPRLSCYVNEEKFKLYNTTIKEVASLLFIVAIPSLIGIACISEPVMYLYAGDKYVDSHGVLIIYSIRTLVMIYYSFFVNQILYIYKKEKFILINLLTFGILNVVIKVILINNNLLTPESAIFSTMMVEIILILIIYIYIIKKIKIKPFLSNHKVYFISSLFFIIISYVIKSMEFSIYVDMVLIIIISCIFYLCILIVSKDPLINKIVERISKVYLKLKN